MPSSLISNTNSEAQFQANLLTNSPKLINVIVEDELDVVIWYRILNLFAPDNQYNIHPYSHDPSFHGKGKAQILRQSSQFGKYFIGCVDSDDDWLLKQWTVDGHTINHSPYILQTYAYSIENLAAQPYGLSDCMIECCAHCSNELHTIDNQYTQFINRISNYVYDVLLWHLTMKKNQVYLNQIALGWDYIFGNGHYNDIHSDGSLSVQGKHTAILERFLYRTKLLKNDYERNYSELKQSYVRLENALIAEYNLSQDNAYLFVRGHNLHDFLMYNFFNPVYTNIINLHKSEICAKTSGIETGNAIKHYRNLLKEFSKDYIYRNTYFADPANLISVKIKTDIDAIFAT